MPDICSAPVPAGEAHTINDGDRKITVAAILNWGITDLRDDWSGARTFCSFGCLAEWAAEMAARHDQHVLLEGKSAKAKKSTAKAKKGHAVADLSPGSLTA